MVLCLGFGLSVGNTHLIAHGKRLGVLLCLGVGGPILFGGGAAAFVRRMALTLLTTVLATVMTMVCGAIVIACIPGIILFKVFLSKT